MNRKKYGIVIIIIYVIVNKFILMRNYSLVEIICVSTSIFLLIYFVEYLSKKR